MCARIKTQQISFKISNEDGLTWPCEYPIYLEGAQGLLLTKKKNVSWLKN
jgi:hypothetical protein